MRRRVTRSSSYRRISRTMPRRLPAWSPRGADAFKSKMNEEFSVTVHQEGVYGVKCAPHYSMGMVALIVVGQPINADEAKAVKHVGKAKTAFSELFGQAVAAK